MSDASGTRLSMSHMHSIIDPDDGNVDFVRINSVKGTYIANFYDEDHLSKALHPTMSQANSIDSYKQTRISFDKGGLWHPIPPP